MSNEPRIRLNVLSIQIATDFEECLYSHFYFEVYLNNRKVFTSDMFRMTSYRFINRSFIITKENSKEIIQIKYKFFHIDGKSRMIGDVNFDLNQLNKEKKNQIILEKICNSATLEVNSTISIIFNNKWDKFSIDYLQKYNNDKNLLSSLYQGGNAIVRTFKQDGQMFVAKMETYQLPLIRYEFFNEIEILHFLNDHPNIAKLCGYSIIDGIFAIVLRHEPHSLEDYLSKKIDLNPSQRKNILYGVCNILSYANFKGILHRDIKPSNILLNENYECILADFGLSRDFSNDMTEAIGTMEYMAPEVSQGSKYKYNSACDIYSLGLVLYQMEKRRRILILDLKRWKNQLKPLIREMLNNNINFRPTAEEIMFLIENDVLVFSNLYETNEKYYPPLLKRDPCSRSILLDIDTYVNNILTFNNLEEKDFLINLFHAGFIYIRAEKFSKASEFYRILYQLNSKYFKPFYQLLVKNGKGVAVDIYQEFENDNFNLKETQPDSFNYWYVQNIYESMEKVFSRETGIGRAYTRLNQVYNFKERILISNDTMKIRKACKFFTYLNIYCGMNIYFEYLLNDKLHIMKTKSIEKKQLFVKRISKYLDNHCNEKNVNLYIIGCVILRKIHAPINAKEVIKKVLKFNISNRKAWKEYLEILYQEYKSDINRTNLFKEIKKANEKGIPEAYYYRGLLKKKECKMNHISQSESYEKLFYKGAIKNCPYCQFEYGNILLDNWRIDEAIDYFHIVINNLCSNQKIRAKAFFKLSQSYLFKNRFRNSTNSEEKVLTSDLYMAILYCNHAKILGNTDAYQFLMIIEPKELFSNEIFQSLLYFTGTNCRHNKEKAYDLILEAIKKNNTTARVTYCKFNFYDNGFTYIDGIISNLYNIKDIDLQAKLLYTILVKDNVDDAIKSHTDHTIRELCGLYEGIKEIRENPKENLFSNKKIWNSNFKQYNESYFYKYFRTLYLYLYDNGPTQIKSKIIYEIIDLLGATIKCNYHHSFLLCGMMSFHHYIDTNQFEHKDYFIESVLDCFKSKGNEIDNRLETVIYYLLIASNLNDMLALFQLALIYIELFINDKLCFEYIIYTIQILTCVKNNFKKEEEIYHIANCALGLMYILEGRSFISTLFCFYISFQEGYDPASKILKDISFLLAKDSLGFSNFLIELSTNKNLFHDRKESMQTIDKEVKSFKNEMKNKKGGFSSYKKKINDYARDKFKEFCEYHQRLDIIMNILLGQIETDFVEFSLGIFPQKYYIPIPSFIGNKGHIILDKANLNKFKIFNGKPNLFVDFIINLIDGDDKNIDEIKVKSDFESTLVFKSLKSITYFYKEFPQVSNVLSEYQILKNFSSSFQYLGKIKQAIYVLDPILCPEEFECLTKIQQENLMIHLSQLLLKNGEIREAISRLEQFRDSNIVAIYLADLYLKNGEILRAREILESFISMIENGGFKPSENIDKILKKFINIVKFIDEFVS